jgi:flavodoxin
MKAQRTPPEYTITKYDAEMIAQMVQDRTSEDFENDVHNRDRIQEDLADMRQLLKQIRKVQATGNIEIGSSTSKIGKEPKSSE